jgi:hypothetical protein
MVNRLVLSIWPLLWKVLISFIFILMADGSQQQQQVLPSANGPQISGQFAEVCTEARARRMDTRLGWQLGKHMRRLADTRAERRFTSARKTVRHF